LDAIRAAAANAARRAERREGIVLVMLVIAAHPDDEVLGCGGYMSVFSEKNEVCTAIVTEGCSAQYAGPGCEDLIERKKAAALAANRVLGVRDVFFGGFPDMRLDTVSHIDVNAFLRGVVSETRPDVILTHHPGDINVDHQLVYSSTLVAARPAGKRAPDLLLYETPSATEWQSYDFKTAFIPNVFIDISDRVEQKLDALKCYDIELRAFPHPRSEKALRAYAAYRGLAAGLCAAEAFRLLRAVDFLVRA
jgi:LmbE family N-acetylglucosaminyl deacetylase